MFRCTHKKALCFCVSPNTRREAEQQGTNLTTYYDAYYSATYDLDAYCSRTDVVHVVLCCGTTRGYFQFKRLPSPALYNTACCWSASAQAVCFAACVLGCVKTATIVGLWPRKRLERTREPQKNQNTQPRDSRLLLSADCRRSDTLLAG